MGTRTLILVATILAAALAVAEDARRVRAQEREPKEVALKIAGEPGTEFSGRPAARRPRRRRRREPPPVRLSAAELRGAIDDFSAIIASQFLDLLSSPTEKVMAAYAQDHLRASPEEDGLGPGTDAS